MSAIGGIVSFTGAPVPDGSIATLNAAMQRRGPDACRTWHEGAVALGCCLLRSTPEASGESQPARDRAGSWVIVWDGRLDNRKELIADLALGEAAAAWPDSEIAMRCYAKWGEHCAARLLGDFAFALWDRTRHELFVARDVIGARPLYWCRTPGFFAFASDDEALLQLPGVPRGVEERRVAYHLLPEYQGFDPASTWYSGVRHLRPGECAVVKPDGDLRSRVFRSIQVREPLRFASDADCRAAFLEVFREAVRCRLRTAGDAAVMASGGIDSASVLATALAIQPTLHTYSAVADNAGESVESQCIATLTSPLGAHAHEVRVPSMTGMLSVRDLCDVAWDSPHPVDNSVVLPALMCLAAHRGGHRVMLTGVSGDVTTHSTFSYLPTLLKGAGWRAAWNEARAAAQRHTYLRNTRPVLLFARALYQAYAPSQVKRTWRGLRSRRIFQGGLIDRAFASRIGVANWLRDARVNVGSFCADVQRQHLAALTGPHGLASTLSSYNRVAGRFAVEIRDPWADVRVVEFFLALPLEQKFRHGWTKYLARTCMEPLLPPAVLWRTDKEGVGWHFLDRLLDETQADVLKGLENGSGEVDTLVDAHAAAALRRSYLRDRGYDAKLRVYDLFTLVDWMRRHREGRT